MNEICIQVMIVLLLLVVPGMWKGVGELHPVKVTNIRTEEKMP